MQTLTERPRDDRLRDDMLPPTLSYRPSLDGIRAVAVLAVFGYHLGYVQMSGGYLGVDVFFVLSGYLITSVLLLEYDATGGIGLLRFWGRRARRLLPALLLLVLGVSLWVWVVSPTLELAQRRQDLLSALFYVSNWHLISSTQSYWANFASASPMRHTWSLAIEEQFYLVWPLLLIAACWLGRGRTRVLLGVAGAGAATSAVLMAMLYSASNPSRAYYGTETRIHQLLIGAILSILVIRVPAVCRARRVGGSVATLAGVILLVSFMTFGDQSPFYYRGGSTLFAIAAAALLWGLEASPTGMTGRVLSVRPATAIGKISYGIYLWHWPVILAVTTPVVLLRSLPGSLGVNLTRLLATGAIAAASFILVESPIRKGWVPGVGPSLRRFALAGVPIVALIAFSVVVFTRPSSSETTSAAQAALSAREDLGCEEMICVRRRSANPQAPVLALIGDSTARSLDPGLMELASRSDLTYVMLASDGCRVTHLASQFNGVSDIYRPCYDAMPGLYDKLIADWHPDVVIDLDRFELTNFLDDSGRVVTPTSPEFMRTERSELELVISTLTQAGGRMVFVELSPVVFPQPGALDRCLEAAASDGRSCTLPASTDQLTRSFDAMLEDLAGAHPEMTLVSISDLVCPGGMCPPTVNGILVRYDGVHFSPDAARWLVPILYDRTVKAGVVLDSAG